MLGLGSIRLQDDLLDDEVPAPDRAAAERLSLTLFELALAAYRRHLPASAPFWRHLDVVMADGEPPPADDHGWQRGVRHCDLAFAVCELAGRMDAFPTLARCLDHALTGLARYDDIGDWQSDLAAGRWNAFVAAAGGHRQQPPFETETAPRSWSR